MQAVLSRGKLNDGRLPDGEMAANLGRARSASCAKRGDASATSEEAVMYLDATDDDLPGALAPKLRYVQTGDMVKVRVKLVADWKNRTRADGNRQCE